MPPPADFLAQIKTSKAAAQGNSDTGTFSAGFNTTTPHNALLASLQKRQAQNNGGPASSAFPPNDPKATASTAKANRPVCPPGKIFHYDEDLEAFLFDFDQQPQQPIFVKEDDGGDILRVPLAPCIYRLSDYTFAKKEPILLQKCLIKLGVLRCFQRECKALNQRLQVQKCQSGFVLEEEELGKARFMELLSNCGVYREVVDMLLQRMGKAFSAATHPLNGNTSQEIPHIQVHGLDEFLQSLEDLVPALAQSRKEIVETQSVSFFPGLGELFTPGSQLVCFPDGMEGVPVGCSCVQSWYSEEINPATQTIRRRFILVVEFLVSVGTELVFVAASEVYPEFHDTSRNMPVKDLTHRKLMGNDADLLRRLQQRGEFYASVATKNYYLEYQPNSFYPIRIGGGGWSGNINSSRPLSKGGRVMVDVERGILEGHLPFRGTSGMSDTVKEAIKLFEQNKRTGIAVPFRTAILPGFEEGLARPDQVLEQQQQSDHTQLWQAWPCLVGFSFTSRVWGKVLLTLPHKARVVVLKTVISGLDRAPDSPRRASTVILGVQRAGLGGVGECGSLNYISFQAKAFEQLVLEESKKELIRAVARNAGGGIKFDDDGDDNDDGYHTDEDSDWEEEEDMGLDVVANKGAASIFLLNGPPGCGKTLTAEAIAELLKKPLYVITAGDLGITASEVEKTLGSVLDLCQTWDALVLIDEADIFLEARSSVEIQRNALVCVMLRLLEYYSGCLFLSSNRAASSIDAAIASRITVMLSYPPLDQAGRVQVWKNLVGLVPITPLDPVTGKIPDRIAKNPRKASRYRIDFSENHFERLAIAYEINGRQIKNSIVLARALARERGLPLSLSILERAVTAVAGEQQGTATIAGSGIQGEMIGKPTVY